AAQIEPAQKLRPRAVDDASRPLVLLGDELAAGGRRGRRKLARRRQHERHELLARRITDAPVFAALEAGSDLDLELVGACARERHLCFDVIAEDLDVAEAVVRVRHAFWQCRGPEVDLALRREGQLVAVQVVAGRDLPADRELVRLVEARIHRERLIDGELVAGRRAVDGADAEKWRGRKRDRGCPFLREVAEAAVRTSLQLDLQVEALDRGGASIRDRDTELVTIDLLVAKEFVAVRFAVRETRGADRNSRRAALEAEASSVQVVTVQHVEVEIELLGIGARGIAEDLLGGQQLVDW